MDAIITYRTALVLARERIYQGRKQKTGASKTITSRALWITNLSALPFYVMVSFFLAGSRVLTGLPVGAFSLLLLTQLFLSILITLNSLSSFRDLDLHRPLLSLPVSREYLLISLSWLFSGGVAILIIPLPAAGILAWTTGNYLAIPVSFLWGSFTVLLGHSVGLLLTNLFSSSPSQRSTPGKVFQILKIGGAFLLFLLWFLIVQYEGLLNPLLEPLSEASESLWFLYPFNASKSIVSFSEMHLLSLALYGVLFSAAYLLAGRKTWESMARPSFAASKGTQTKVMVFRGRLRSLIWKDLVLSFRKGQNFLAILVFPLMILFMNLIGIIQGESVSPLNAQIAYLATAVASGWGISYLYVQEGDSAWIMSALPISKLEFAFQKALSAFSLFPIYVVPAILFVSFRIGLGSLITTMQILSAFAMSLTSCIIVSTSLSHKLPQNFTVITQETFGSRFHPIFLIFKSAILSIWPVAVILGIFLFLEGADSTHSLLLYSMLAVGTTLNLAFTVWRNGLLEILRYGPKKCRTSI